MDKRIAKKIFDATFGTLRAAHYYIRSLFPQKMPTPDQSAIIDVAIPVIPKDLPTLPFCVEAVRRFIPHKIQNIYLVAPDTPATRQAAQSLGLIFIDETTILPGSPNDIHIDRPDRQNRKGWIFQQFIKLSARIGTAPDILFIDADHILLKPHTFIAADGKRIFYASKESYFPYYDNIRTITGQFPLHPFSFIAHKMLFNRKALGELQSTLLSSPLARKINAQQPNTCTDWKEIILHSLDWDYSSPFSEFELYPHLLPSASRSTILWRQIALDKLPFTESIENTTPSDVIDLLAAKYPHALSVTFPAYLRT